MRASAAILAALLVGATPAWAAPAHAPIETAAFKAFISPAPDPHSIFYVVRPGDKLAVIAHRNHVTPELLERINGIEKRKLRPGEKIKIPTYRLHLVVDKADNRLTLKGDEEILKIYTVSTGADNSTPTGTFKIIDKLKNPTWYKSDGEVIPYGSPEHLLGTRWMGLNVKGRGIHGTTEPGLLGRQVSHGCIRMRNKEVEELFDMLPRGTEVTIVDKK